MLKSGEKKSGIPPPLRMIEEEHGASLPASRRQRLWPPETGRQGAGK